MELFLLVTLPKDYINISGNGMKLPFIIPVVRKIFPLCISQFNKPVFFSIEGFHRRNLISGRFFFQCSESCIIKRSITNPTGGAVASATKAKKKNNTINQVCRYHFLFIGKNSPYIYFLPKRINQQKLFA